MSGAGKLTLVGHRGWPVAFPENTLLGFQQAVIHGARWIETDVQCTRDGVPVLYHDVDMMRVSGVAGRIHEIGFAELDGLSAHSPQRFGNRFGGVPIPSLKAFAGWLVQHRNVTAFVEIKEESLTTFGTERVMAGVAEALKGLAAQCIVISFDDRCLEYTAARYALRTGWVLPAWNADIEARAHALSPDYLFVNQSRLPPRPEDYWRGPWQWAVYVIDELDEALAYAERDLGLVETDSIGKLLVQCPAGAG